ncbi:MAG TPA: sigma-54 dependent transcriptional regulator [Thermoanaerobaculia bacterium]|nr:sigma-54 dependent transcriptional regulator [Thermoanaerobaculia bacterium]
MGPGRGVEGRLAVVEDDSLLLDQLVWALRERFEVHSARDAVEGLRLAELEPDVYLLDLRLPPSGEAEEGLRLLQAIRQRQPDATVVVMTAEKERRWALKAIEMGAFDFFRKPLEKSDLLHVLGRAMERHRILAENRALKEDVFRRESYGGLVGESPGMRALFALIEKVAPTDATVLVTGESGTGKELVAEAIHRGSPRKAGPFVAVNSSALTETLAESELFGHERGAFTGAVASRAGRFELAHGGTLFLDEVATLSPAVQAKLLRVLERHDFERVGGTKTIHVDIRLVAATNEDLEQRVAAGTFRNDLFYRLNTVTLRIPPLRERREDVPLLVDFFAARAAARHGRDPKTFSPAAFETLARHPFHGNVRELEHLVEMLTLMVDGDTIGPEHLPGTLSRASGAGEPVPPGLSFAISVKRFEKELVSQAIARAGGVKARAAEALGLDANQMKYLCRKHRL